MKIENISVTLRKNLGNYEHIEISATGFVEENEDQHKAMQALKKFVAISIGNETEENTESAPVEEVKPEPVVEGPKKEKKTRAKKSEAVIAPSELPPVEPEVFSEPVGKNVVVYNSNIPEHKSIFAGYLSEKYGNSWKTVNTTEKIKEFTTSLNGKHFLDDDGKIAPTFLSEVHGFFGA